MIPWTKMPSHWDKKGDEYLVPTKFGDLNSVGDVDQQTNTIKDFIVAYNTAEIDFDLVLGEEPSGDAGEDGAEADADEEGADEEEMEEDEEEEFLE